MAVLGAQPQYVLASEACNRAFQDGGACGSLADFLSELRSQPRIRRPAHQTQRLLDPLVGDQAEERRLFELYRQPLASVSSNTGSPVVFLKSARTMVSLSVSARLAMEIEERAAGDAQNAQSGC